MNKKRTRIPRTKRGGRPFVPPSPKRSGSGLLNRRVLVRFQPAAPDPSAPSTPEQPR